MTIETFDYCRTQKELDAAIKNLSQSPRLAIDTETYARPEWGTKGSALDCHTGAISLMILKGEGKPVIVDVLYLQETQADFSELKELLFSRDYLLFHNARFDLKFMQSTFGWMPTNVRCTLVMAKLCSNATGSKAGKQFGHGYADLCKNYLNINIEGKGTVQTSTWLCGLSKRTLDNEWWLEKLMYAAKDVEYLFDLEEILLQVLTTPLPDSPLTNTGQTEAWGLDMLEVLQRELNYIPVIARREYIGLPVSKKMLNALQKAAENQLNDCINDLSTAFKLDPPKPDWEGRLVASRKTKQTLNSSTGLKECIQKAIKLSTLDNVQGNVLKRLVDILDTLAAAEDVDEENEGGASVFIDENEELLYHELLEIEHSELMRICPIMQRVLDFKRLSKQVSMDLRKYINPKTGRIHTKLDQLGTATGRLSSSGPNLQQVSARTTIVIDLPKEDLFNTGSLNVRV